MIKSDQVTPYVLQSMVSGKLFDDSGWLLDAPGEEKPGLVRAIYPDTHLELLDDQFGIYKFSSWLPVKRFLKGSSAPVTYRSMRLAELLGLENLYITFSGYWPERNAFMNTCSFKETEAYSVCGRLDPAMGKTLVVASAGNTARAFARVCSENLIPLILCVPEDCLDALWFEKPIHDCVTLLATPKGSDYFDAIHLSSLVSQIDGYVAEGGAKNVARRDGMGTTVLSATTHIGRIPDYYFQAVGSGTGAIAAWEANLRLLADGRYGQHKMKLMLSQNSPFHPMYDAWKVRSRALLPMDDELARKKVEEIDAKVLSNRRPPWALAGGLFDALSDAGGEILLVNNEELRQAATLFANTEGMDIHPAAAVSVASLVGAIQAKLIPKDAVVMLNITGGGEARYKADHKVHFLKSAMIIDPGIEPEELAGIMERRRMKND